MMDECRRSLNEFGMALDSIIRDLSPSANALNALREMGAIEPVGGAPWLPDVVELMRKMKEG